MSRIRRAALPLLFLMGCTGGSGAGAVQSSGERPFTVEPVATFNQPWAMTFLPDGRMLVTEKGGTLQLLSADRRTRTPVAGTLPVSIAGQGGLMDVVLHPGFAQNHLVYFSFSERNAQGLKGVALARGTFNDSVAPCMVAPCPQPPRLDNVQVIFRASPYVDGDGHFSGRIAFAPDGHLFFTNGERQKFTPAQDPQVTLGKVLRLNDDGTPAAGNPLAARGFNPAIWSYGSRNLLGLAFAPDGNLWEIEMGPKGGDEVNLIRPGLNYGWPNASNGSHYDNRDIPDHRPGDGYEAPKVWWNPSISPSSLMIYSGNLFPQWRGDAFIGALSGEALIHIDINGAQAAKADQWAMGARIREVEQGPDGAIYVLEDGDNGRLLRLTPSR